MSNHHGVNVAECSLAVRLQSPLLIACTKILTDISSNSGVERGKAMKIGMVIYSNDPETVWNAFRFGNHALEYGDEVKVFLLAKGVECESLDTDEFKVTEQVRSFVDGGGKILACGTCLEVRQSKGSKTCPLSTLRDLYEIVKESDRVLTF